MKTEESRLIELNPLNSKGWRPIGRPKSVIYQNSKGNSDLKYKQEIIKEIIKKAVKDAEGFIQGINTYSNGKMVGEICQHIYIPVQYYKRDENSSE